jgi:hypothetical protein
MLLRLGCGKVKSFNHKGHPFDSFALLSRSGQAVEREVGYSNLRQSGMAWDEAGGVGVVIAEIARHRRHRKTTTSPLISTDDTHQE